MCIYERHRLLTVAFFLLSNETVYHYCVRILLFHQRKSCH